MPWKQPHVPDPRPDAEQVTVPGIDRFVVRDVILALRAPFDVEGLDRFVTDVLPAFG